AAPPHHRYMISLHDALPIYPVDETVPHLGDIDAGSRPFEHNRRTEPLAVRVGGAVAHHRGPFRCALAEPLADRAQARAAGSIDDLGAVGPVDDEHARFEHDGSGMFAVPGLRRIPDDVLALGQVEQPHIFELSFGSDSAGLPHDHGILAEADRTDPLL